MGFTCSIQQFGHDRRCGCMLQPIYRWMDAAAHPLGTVDPDATTPAQWGEGIDNAKYRVCYRRSTTIIIQNWHGGTTIHLIGCL